MYGSTRLFAFLLVKMTESQFFYSLLTKFSFINILLLYRKNTMHKFPLYTFARCDAFLQTLICLNDVVSYEKYNNSKK